MKIKLIIRIFAFLFVMQLYVVVHAQTPAPTPYSKDDLGFLGGEGALVKTPAGFCIVDIASVVDKSSNVFPKWDATDEKGFRLGYRLNYWDVPVGRDSAQAEGNGFMNLSVLIDKIESGNCLSQVQFRIGQNGVTPQAPNSVGGAKPWVYRGSWAGPHVWQPGGNGAANAIGVLYTQEMNQNSDEIITGITLQRRGACQGDATYKFSSYTINRCVAAWKGEGGGNANSYYDLQVQSTKYADVKPPSPVIQSVSGSWVKVLQCSGCPSHTYQTQIGITKGQSIGSETETSRSLAVTLGATVGTNEKAPVQVQTSVSVTGTLTETLRKSITDSFDTAVQTQSTVNCDKAALWQWNTTVGLTNGLESAAKSSIYVCTDKQPSNIRDITWSGQ